MSIYSPRVIAYANAHGITDLQAYRALKARAAILERVERRNLPNRRKRPPLLERLLGISPDWNDY